MSFPIPDGYLPVQPTETMLRWYVLHTKPHKERQVAAKLQEWALEAYYPTVPAPRRRGRPTERAFFPCYLFVRVDLASVGVWRLTYMPGVRRLVMFGESPAVIDDGAIATLRSRLGQVDVVDQRGEILTPGDRVSVLTGPLAGLEAVFDKKLSAQGRVRILIRLMEHWSKVELNADALRRRTSPSSH